MKKATRCILDQNLTALRLVLIEKSKQNILILMLDAAVSDAAVADAALADRKATP